MNPKALPASRAMAAFVSYEIGDRPAAILGLIERLLNRSAPVPGRNFWQTTQRGLSKDLGRWFLSPTTDRRRPGLFLPREYSPTYSPGATQRMAHSAAPRLALPGQRSCTQTRNKHANVTLVLGIEMGRTA